MGEKFKIAVITAARSEYGLLQWLITDLENDDEVELSLIATGSHLSEEQGLTYRQIESDGHIISKKAFFAIDNRSARGIAKSIGMCGSVFADVLADIRPDILVVLGDRYELLPICSTALVQNIPIAHISGGDITEGAIDNQIRNSVTMMASIHFPGTQDSADNIERMLGRKIEIYNVGEPGLETFRRTNLMSRQELAKSLDIDVNKRWIICTLHPETVESHEYNLNMAKYMVEAVCRIDNCEVVITAANADLGGAEMNKYLQAVCETQSGFHFIHSLGQHRYLSMMSQAYALIGNTSSGIVEASFLGVPVVNIGNRQSGRHLCTNVISAEGTSTESISKAIEQIPENKFEPDYYYGDGDTSHKIVSHLKEYLKCKKK